MIALPTSRFLLNSLLATTLIGLISCTNSSSSEWHKKNDELIAKYDLKSRTLSSSLEPTVASNLEEGKVKSLDGMDSVALHPGVSAKVFWGTGTMISVLQLAPNAKIPS